MESTHVTQEQADEFAIGSLPPEVAYAVILHADTCAACRDIVGESQRAAAALVIGLRRYAPPERLKGRVLRDAGITRPGPVAWAARLLTAGAGIAAVVVAIASFAGLVSLRGQVDELRDGNAQLQANIDGALPTKVELAALTRRLSDTEKNNADLLAAALGDRELLLALLSPDSDVADVIPVNDSVNAIGRFVWDDAQKKVWFVANKLAATQKDQTYQLWVNSGGRYISLGTFNPDAAGYARYETVVPQGLKSYESAVVTIETAGGASERSGPSVFVTDLSRIRR